MHNRQTLGDHVNSHHGSSFLLSSLQSIAIHFVSFRFVSLVDYTTLWYALLCFALPRSSLDSSATRLFRLPRGAIKMLAIIIRKSGPRISFAGPTNAGPTQSEPASLGARSAGRPATWPVWGPRCLPAAACESPESGVRGPQGSSRANGRVVGSLRGGVSTH